MKIFYNVTGSERKALAAAISQELNAPTEYLGAPTFAYRVGDYHIDKAGVMEGPGDMELVAAIYALHGFKADNVEHNELPSGDPQPVADEPEILHEDADADCDDCTNTLTIELPLEGFTEENLTNLEKLIASKANLIRKALGVDALPIERTDSTIRFPWFSFGKSGEEVSAYARFIGALCATARKQERVTAKEKDVENEKFAFRVFLIRLGFIGDDYKSARKILLRSLAGNSAFKTAPMDECEVNDHE